MGLSDSSAAVAHSRGSLNLNQQEDVACREAEQEATTWLVGDRGGEEWPAPAIAPATRARGQLSHASSADRDEEHQDRDEQAEDPGQVAHAPATTTGSAPPSLPAVVVSCQSARSRVDGYRRRTTAALILGTPRSLAWYPGDGHGARSRPGPRPDHKHQATMRAWARCHPSRS